MKHLLTLLIILTTLSSQTIDDVVDNFSTYDGQTVTLTGILLNDFGVMHPTRTDIYLVSSSGKALNLSSETTYPSLKRGDQITVTGEISAYFDIYQIAPTSAPTVNSSNNTIPDPILATTGDVASITYHGSYVQVTGVVSAIGSSVGGGRNITINDGSGDVAVRVWDSTGIDISSVQVGQTWTMQGGTGTFSNAGQIEPGVQGDIFQGAQGYGFLSNPSAATTETSATISFTTTASSTAVISYGTTTSYGSTKNITIAATNFSETLSGLTANTTYHYKVDITNASNSSETDASADQTFFTSSSNNTDIGTIVDNFSTYNGQTVTIEGILLNDFGKIQTGRTNINISGPDGKVLNVSSTTQYTNLERGMQVSITGGISEYNGTYQIQPDSDPTVLANDQAIPDPISAKTGDVNSLRHGSQYVVVAGTVIDAYNTGTSGANIEIDDGTGFTTVRLWATTGLTISNIVIGELYTISGVTGEFSGSGQIIPSDEEEIVQGIVGGDDVFGSKSIALEVKSQTYDINRNQDIDILYKAPTESQVRITIYDIAGRKVKSFATKNGLGFSSGVRWNLVTDNFQKVKIGTYLVYMEVVESNGRKTGKKAIIVVGTRM